MYWEAFMTLKYTMACRGFNQRMGLVKLAEKLNVINCEGRNHQAGYDSLITALSFLKLKKDGMSEDKAAGIFYGLHRCGLRRTLGHYTCRWLLRKQYIFFPSSLLLLLLVWMKLYPPPTDVDIALALFRTISFQFVPIGGSSWLMGYRETMISRVCNGAQIS